MKRSMLQQYKILVEFLGHVLGPDYEVALHDFSDKSYSIVAISNGHISGRQIGAPLTKLALAMISDKRYLNKDFHANYTGMSNDNKVLRSSTMYLKDETGKLVGMLCINFDDSRFQDVSNQLFQLCHPNMFVDQNLAVAKDLNFTNTKEENDTEHFPDSMSSIMENFIHEIIQQDGIPVQRLTRAEKVKIVGRLDAQGVFLLKGSVNFVAEALCSSPATIYRYLNKKE